MYCIRDGIKMLYEKKIVKIIETIFDALYLCFVWISACLFLFSTSSFGSLQWNFGWITLLLAIGDSVHLIPRIRAMWDHKISNHTTALGIGKMISSITMTLFYFGLWHIGTAFYNIHHPYGRIAVNFLVIIRIFLCLMPQNKWTSKESSSHWPFIRNLPFFLLGLIVMLLFAVGSLENKTALQSLWLAILVSFACYLPVVLFSKRNPKIGMLMIPKSLAYIAIVFMGFSLPGL